MKDVTTLHVRKSSQLSGAIRYRFSVGRIDYSLKEMRQAKGFKFKYGSAMKPSDIKTVEDQWKTKLVK